MSRLSIRNLFAVLIFLAACAPGDLRPNLSSPVATMIAQNDWSGALKYYESKLESEPLNAEFRGGYFSVVEQAVDYYLQRARRFSQAGDFSSAEGQLSRGLLLLPESTRLREELQSMDDLRQARSLYRNALVESRLGHGAKALDILERSLSLDPNFTSSLRLFDKLSSQSRGETGIAPIRLKTGAAVSINFKNASFKEAALALGQVYGVNMIFDAELDDRPVSIFAENVGFQQAFQLLLKSNRSFYRRLGQNSVVIASDSVEKRAEYQDYFVRTFFLKSTDAQLIADLLTRTLGIQTVSANPDGKSVTIRDTPARLALADQLIAVNDREPAEVVLEVEILEVNRTKTEQLGLSFGSQISITPPSLTIGDIFPVTGLGDVANSSAVSLPAATFRFFKQDVDARTLASPRIRTVNGKEAVIHVGDRVPLRSSTIQDSNGQTRTTFEYRDIGIKLNVTPEIKLNGSLKINVDLEVSSLGQNLGTADEPAFVIGTRNISTAMVLDDGETAIIGGLIRDEERDSVQQLPGVKPTSFLGRLFRQRDGQGTRTDILLTLTPKIVRGLQLPSIGEAQFYSGTGNNVTDQNPFDFLEGPGKGERPVIRLDLSGSASGSATTGLRSGVSLPVPSLSRSASSEPTPVLAFTRTNFETTVGGTVDISITASGFPDTASGSFVIRYRKDLVEPVDVATSANIPFKIDKTKGEIRMELTQKVGGEQTRNIAKIQFKGMKPGLSFLIITNVPGQSDAGGLPGNVELQASRIVVR